jgi:hypothetical protein
MHSPRWSNPKKEGTTTAGRSSVATKKYFPHDPGREERAALEAGPVQGAQPAHAGVLELEEGEDRAQFPFSVGSAATLLGVSLAETGSGTVGECSRLADEGGTAESAGGPGGEGARPARKEEGGGARGPQGEDRARAAEEQRDHRLEDYRADQQHRGGLPEEQRSGDGTAEGAAEAAQGQANRRGGPPINRQVQPHGPHQAAFILAVRVQLQAHQQRGGGALPRPQGADPPHALRRHPAQAVAAAQLDQGKAVAVHHPLAVLPVDRLLQPVAAVRAQAQAGLGTTAPGEGDSGVAGGEEGDGGGGQLLRAQDHSQVIA